LSSDREVRTVRAKIRSFLYFLLAVAAVFVVLKTLNWLPSVLQKDTMRRYGSLEEMRAALNIKDMYVPSYYPPSISWPPSEILAQAKPFPAVIMVYNRAGSGDAVLVVSQAAAERPFPDAAVKIVQSKEKVPYLLKGRNALLEVGLCRNAETCSRIAWNEGGTAIAVTMKSTPFELIRIAESMLR
jgi:hypothetical protein